MKFEICHIFVIHKKPTQVLENFSFQSIPTNEENNIPVRYFGETIDLTSKGISLPKLVQILVGKVLNWQVKP